LDGFRCGTLLSRVEKKNSKISYRSYRQLSEVAYMEKRGRLGKVILKLKFIKGM